MISEGDQDRNFKAFYRNDRILTPMQGDEVEMIKFSISMSSTVAVTFSFSRKDVYGRIVALNPITGRLTMIGGRGNATWMRTFLKRDVKVITFDGELYDLWLRERGK